MSGDTESQKPSPELRADMLDLTALWAAVKRHRAWIIGPTVAAAGLTFVVVNLITPRYTGEARILLESRESFYTRPGQGTEAAVPNFDSEGVQSQVQIIMSRDVARESIRRLGLVGNPEFDSGAGSVGVVRKLAVMLGLGSHPAEQSPEERVLEKFSERLLAFPVGRSRIVAVEFSSADPALATRAANTIAATYLEVQEAAKQDTARSASAWLSQTIEPLRKRVAEAESRVEEFRSRNGLLVGTNNTTITSQQLADLSTQLSNARSQQAEAQAKAGLIRDAIKQNRTFEIPDVANNELVRRLIEQRVTLRAQIASETRTLMAEHPRIKEMSAQLADLEGQIRAAAERAVRTLENEARIAGQRVESFTAALDGQKKNVSSANDSEVQLRALEREARTLRDQLEQYMLRNREAIARDTQNAAPADARIISRAVEPTTPSFPKKLPTILVATLAAFLVSLGTVVSRELLNGSAGNQPKPLPKAPRWVGGDAVVDESARRERVAGLLASNGRFGQVTLDYADPDTTIADLAAIAAEPPRGMAPMALVIDGAGPQASTALQVAELMSQRCRCIVVELGSDESGEQPGFSELLSGEALFSDVITRAPHSRLHRIASGRAGREAVLAAPDLVDVALDALSETYDWVIVAAASEDEASMLAPLLRRVQSVLVMSGRIGNGHAVETAYRLAEATQAPVAIVLDAEPVYDRPVAAEQPVPA